MRRYFYGEKVQVLTTANGIPVEFGFVPGCKSDVQALKKLPLGVDPESSIYGDAAYTDYNIEDDMLFILRFQENRTVKGDRSHGQGF